MKAAGWAFTALGGTFGPPFKLLTVTKPLVGAATVYFVVDTLLIATAIGLSTRQGIVGVWRENLLRSAPGYFATSSSEFSVVSSQLSVLSSQF